ncbi:flagellar basal-body rod protein FlgG [Clostridium botulinum C str. Eklund]|nr:flagellar basal-body rod protein FlgG [Clostridium botulinum C str. Eklund]NEZ48474.1 flagellar basal body rod protein FlgG [Clostridium botulinum]
MIRSIYTAVSGLINQEAQQDVISNNLANATTVGYKKDDLVGKSFKDVMMHNYDKVVRGKHVKNDIGMLSMGCKLDQTYTNFTQGALQSTDKKTDFALQGKGFFTVSRGGRNFYTRDGHFHVDRGGYLVNSTGDKVIGKNLRTGATEPINVMQGGKPSKISCNDSGEMFVGNDLAYKVQVVDFNNYEALSKEGDNLYTGGNPNVIENTMVKQGYLEKSNINVMEAVSDMMMSMRNFESNQKLVQSLDETLGKTVNEVGRV